MKTTTMKPMAIHMTFSGVRLTSFLSVATCFETPCAAPCCVLETAPDMSLKSERTCATRSCPVE